MFTIKDFPGYEKDTTVLAALAAATLLNGNEKTRILTYILRNEDLANINPALLLKLADRVQAFFWNNDDVRFTPEDLVDAVTSSQYLPRLPKLMAVSDEDFDQLVVAAAEEYRADLESGMEKQYRTFKEMLSEVPCTSKLLKLEGDGADTAQQEAYILPLYVRIDKETKKVIDIITSESSEPVKPVIWEERTRGYTPLETVEVDGDEVVFYLNKEE